MPTEIETLTQKIKAYEQVLKSQERVISHYREQEKKWQEAIYTLESEREMNRKLTEELEFWKKHCSQFMDEHSYSRKVEYRRD